MTTARIRRAPQNRTSDEWQHAADALRQASHLNGRRLSLADSIEEHIAGEQSDENVTIYLSASDAQLIAAAEAA